MAPEPEPISPSPSEKPAFAEAPWPMVVVGWLVDCSGIWLRGGKKFCGAGLLGTLHGAAYRRIALA